MHNLKKKETHFLKNSISNFKQLGPTSVALPKPGSVNTGEMVDLIRAKCKQRIYFLRQLASFRVNQTILLNFYRGIIESILTSSITVWFGRITNDDLEKLNSIVRTCEHIIGTELLPLEYIYYQRLERKTKLILKEHFHPANKCFQFLRSGN